MQVKLNDTDTITKSWEVLISQVEKYFSFSKKDNKDFPLGYYDFRVNIDNKPWVVDMFDRVWCTTDGFGENYFACQYASHPNIKKNIKLTVKAKCSSGGHFDVKTNKLYLLSFSAPQYGVSRIQLMIRKKL